MRGEKATGDRAGDAAEPRDEPGPRRRIGVVVNGNARSVTADVIATLDEVLDRGDIFLSRKIEDSEGIARTLLDRGYDTILTAGGDGTFTVIVTAVVKEATARGITAPRFGLLSLGTGNSLAWVLGASRMKKGGRGARAVTVDVSRLQADAGSRPLPLVEVDDTLSPFCGFGVDANVLRHYAATKKLLARGPLAPLSSGLFAYALSTVTRTFPEYLVKPTPHCRVTNRGGDVYRIGRRGALVGAAIKAGSVVYEGPATIAAVSTIPYYGFGLRLFPYAEDRPGKMQLRISRAATIPFIKNMREIWRGEWDDPEYMFDYSVDAVDVELDPPTAFQIGGDVKGDRDLAEIRLGPSVRVVDFYAPPRG
jgi:diacylglycerol kinase family enzyme